jgi:Cys-tRNA(Pro)/Cys-tRNA(Cys) deacylase
VTTRGIEQLRARGIPFERLDYDPIEKSVRYAAAVLDLPQSRVLKSVVFASNAGRFVFALMAADGNVSAKKLARAVGAKRMAPASPRDAQRITGYRIGGISPLGARERLPVVLDVRASREPWLVLNAGDRGVLVRLGTSDALTVLTPLIADIRIG